MSRTPRPPAAAALVALVSVIGAGCASNAPTGSRPAASSHSAGASVTGQDKAVKFAECIRQHDVPHFPDPDAKGEFAFGVDVSPAIWKRAVDACKDLQPPGALSSKRSPKQQRGALAFAKCIRDNGVKDFPDPVDGEPLIDTTRIPSTDKPGGMRILDAAIQKCRALSGLDAGGQGGQGG